MRVFTLWAPDAAHLAAQADDVLSEEEARRAASFRGRDDRHRYVVAHVWLRRLLGDALDVAPGRVPIEAGRCAQCGGPHGKPQLPASTGLHFSLSHSGDVALCAVADAPVGVDVEAIPADARHLELLDCLEPRERAVVASAPASAQPEAFTRCWVRKEAYLKGTGEGLGREPQSVRVGVGSRFDDPGPAAGELGGWQLVDLDAPPGHAAAMAVMI
jgi:4'-phosphopantetheinyl transferase